MRVKNKKTILSLMSLIFLFLMLILPFLNVFTVDFVDGHDFLLHFHMIFALEDALKKGVFLPRWLPDAVYGYGTPIFTFMWGVPYYFGAFLHISGLTYQQVFKILIILPSILSGIGFFIWLKPKYGQFAAVIASIVYIWTPYRFLDSFIRNALGELFFFAFLPFIFFFLDHIDSKKNIILGALFAGLLIYSHQGLSLIAYPLIIFYILFNFYKKRQKELLLNQFLLICGGLLITFFYWFPVLNYQHLLPISQDRMKTIWFPPFLSLIRSKWEGGSVFEGKQLIMSFQIGLTNLGIILTGHLFALYSFIKRNNKGISFVFWLIIFWISIFFLQPISKWFWIHIPLIINLQFPFRMLFIPMFVSAVLSGLILSYLNKHYRLIVGIVIIFAVVVANRNHLRVLNKEINSNEIKSYQGTYDVGGEKLPKYVILKDILKEFEGNPTQPEFTLISGEGKVISWQRKDYESSAEIIMNSEGKLRIRRIYFPGWKIYQNEQKISEMKIEKGNGMILSLTKGKSYIKVEYKDPFIVVFSNFVSAITLLFFIIILLLPSRTTLLDFVKNNSR